MNVSFDIDALRRAMERAKEDMADACRVRQTGPPLPPKPEPLQDGDVLIHREHQPERIWPVFIIFRHWRGQIWRGEVSGQTSNITRQNVMGHVSIWTPLLRWQLPAAWLR